MPAHPAARRHAIVQYWQHRVGDKRSAPAQTTPALGPPGVDRQAQPPARQAVAAWSAQSRPRGARTRPPPPAPPLKSSEKLHAGANNTASYFSISISLYI